jgi:DNA helicase-2/ATP-dependent DNA helicase PcrA
MFSLQRLGNIKHLVIDEMQDFSPLALKVLETIFPCPKTILGDINQTLFKTLSDDYLKTIQNLLQNSQLIELEKSYRSTKQITQFSAKLLGIKNILHINREGAEVNEMTLGNDELIHGVINFIFKQKAKGYGVAVICETEQQAEQIFVKLSEFDDVVLVTEEQQTMPDEQTCLIMSVATSKGLEFDSVLAVSKTENDIIGKNLLYVASTRALHELEVIYLA